MKAIGIIPCRDGSRRMPGKNIAELGGQPLLWWTVDAAKKSKRFEVIVGSTNDNLIERMLDDLGVECLRSELHNLPDGAPMSKIVREVVEVCSEVAFDAVVLLQPTSPFRSARDICAALDLMEERDADAVVSVCETTVMEVGHAGRLRPSERRGIVQHNGAIYAVKRSVLERGLDWETAQLIYAYEMTPERSIDIDTVYDMDDARRRIDAHVIAEERARSALPLAS